MNEATGGILTTPQGLVSIIVIGGSLALAIVELFRFVIGKLVNGRGPSLQQQILDELKKLNEKTTKLVAYHEDPVDGVRSKLNWCQRMITKLGRDCLRVQDLERREGGLGG